MAQEAVQQNNWWSIPAQFMSIHFPEPQALAFPFHLTIDSLCSCHCHWFPWIIVMAIFFFFWIAFKSSLSVSESYISQQWERKGLLIKFSSCFEGSLSFSWATFCHVKMDQFPSNLCSEIGFLEEKPSKVTDLVLYLQRRSYIH